MYFHVYVVSLSGRRVKNLLDDLSRLLVYRLDLKHHVYFYFSVLQLCTDIDHHSTEIQPNMNSQCGLLQITL